MSSSELDRKSSPIALNSSEVHKHLDVLDGWRGISILSVLACHFLPLGPKNLEFNSTAGLLGMSLFFTLSGFLITSTLYRQPKIVPFLIRRCFRILPLAYVYIATSLFLLKKPWDFWIAHVFFLINYQHQYFTELTGHFWSICVEMHFYFGVAFVVLLAGKHGLFLLPMLGILVTILRIGTGTHFSIVTHLRVDEILAGAILALVMAGALPNLLRAVLTKVPWYLWLLLLLLSCHGFGGSANYFRPYFAAGLVGNTICCRSFLHGFLESRPLKYVAEISYSLYIIHPLAAWGWLGTGGTLEKYAIKRPLTFALTFFSSHLSTFFFEKRWTDSGKTLASRASHHAQ